jgi:Mce-associated membrane protein
VSDAPTWYDLLDVSSEASADEIRAAWKTQIADLEPGDRRFDALNRAAKVLLDPAARETYDTQLGAEVADEAPSLVEEGALAHAPLVEEGALAPVTRPRPVRPGLVTRLRRSSTSTATPTSERRDGDVPSWLLAGLGVLAAGLVGATAWTWTAGAEGDDSAAREAQVAAERAVVPVLSYDYETLEADQRAAQALMTGGYREEYDKLFTVLEDNAPQTQTRVTADVVASGIVRAAPDRVQVLVFVDRPTTNKLNAEPVVYKDQVTVAMQLVDGEWLVDDLTTSPVQG